MPNTTVFAVASAKGGVGKTTTSINLGTALAAHGLDVVVVELDLAMANVVDFLSLDFDDEGDPSMHEVLAGEIPVTDALYDAPGGATIVPSGTSLEALGSVDMSNLSDAIEALEERFDAVVLDTGAGVNSATTTALQIADETILVSTPRVASIRDTEKTQTIVEQRGGEVGGLVLTQAGTGSSPGSQRLTEFLGVDLLCTVPQDPSIHESQDAGVPVTERRPDSEAAQAYADGAAALVESTIGKSGPGESATDEQPADGSSEDASAEDESAMDEMLTEELADEPANEPSRNQSDDTKATTPSKEALEAQGWTFPGASNGETRDEGVGPETDVVDHRTQDRDIRPLTADGGEASLPDEAYGPASPRNVQIPSPAEQLPDDLRSTAQRDEADRADGEAIDDIGDDDDGSDKSLAGRVSALLRRSE